ncbi:aromatic acid exporter family protein [Paenibacillus oleatilyticus]|uniref:aromatic acid exporter family protein n=1 Tax=Paenibacillus oleatilyticus TaxID=2594886 RepID=UPI001C1F55BE|nr:aromatic acid exporter family protein [Paenibacillus oleatilyticus]MBU7317085.1 aromatic acid exporter family protein [Paenibacillus oleatilyticus]
MGFRVIKTALAVIVSIFLAQTLGLQSPLSAGLLAVLGVDVTKKRGLQTSFQRIAASIVGLFFGAGLFWALGFHVWVIGVFILVLYPILSRLKLKEGIVTGSVVMFHVFASGQVSAELLLNEIALLLVGLGTATLINIGYMPREDKLLQEYKQRVEQLFSQIFLELSHHLRDNEYIWSGAELLEADDAIRKAIQVAQRANENNLFAGGPNWSVYFYMRERQLDAIQRMVQLVARIYQTLPHGELLALVFDGLTEDVKVAHYTGRSEKKLNELEQQFRYMPLPATREEFEVRAALLQLVEELKMYLSVAKKEKRPVEEPLGRA